MSVRLLTVVMLLALACARQCPGYTSGDHEFRACWVDAWHDGFKTPTQVDQLIADCRRNHVNAIMVQMRLRGNTFFPSSYEPWAPSANPSFDALAYIIQKAHSGAPRIEVHCFFATLAVATSWPSDPNHVCLKHPQYLSKNESGSTFDGSNYWVDPGHPEAEEYTYNVVMDVVNRYDVDGIHLDLIRYATQTWGYNEVSVSRFNSVNGRAGQPPSNDSAWCQWRRDQVTNLVRKVYANTIAAKPNVKVSAAVFTGDPVVTSDAGWINSQAYRVRFQDWRAWMEEGILDLVVPMDYYPCDSSHFEDWICFILNHQYDRAAAIGYSATEKECWCVQEQVGNIRNPGCSAPRAHGFAQFSYWSGGLDCLGQMCPTSVAVPDMPWKSSPATGHIKGTVHYGGIWMDHAIVDISGPVSRTMYADGTGFYAFVDLPPGTYTVAAANGSYGSRTESVTVTAGQVSTRDIDLNRGGITFSNVQTSNETATSVTVTWTTNILCTSQVYYGTDRTCSSLTSEDTANITNHSVTITGLQPQTAYYFRVVSRTATVPLAMSGTYAFVTMPSRPDVIIDNPQATYSGTWTYSSGSGCYGTNYHWVSTATNPARTATYTPNLPVAGDYKVSVYYPVVSSRSDQAPYTINYNGGSVTIPVNQRINGSTWLQLKETTGQMREVFPFVAGTSGNVVLSNAALGGYYVSADAVRFQLQPETAAPSVPTGLQAQAISHDQMRLTWTPSTDNVAVAGYRVVRDGSVVGVSTTDSFTDLDLTANKRYTYSISAYDTSGNRSGNSTSVSRHTLSLPPTSARIACNKPAGVWQTANPFIFSLVGNFGDGTVSYYAYWWDASPTHVWTGGEYSWLASTISVSATPGPEPFYLHLTGYNEEYLPNGSLDLGPYYLDTTSPEPPTVTDEGDSVSSATMIHATWSAADPESGIALYQYAVGSTPGGNDVAGWSATTETEAVIAIPEQQVGAVLYVSVKAKNGAGAWGEWGVSDGVTVGKLLQSPGQAKGYPDGSVVRLPGHVVTAVFGDCIYVARPNEPWGIRVDAIASVSIGDKVDVGGKLATVMGERCLTDAAVSLAP